MGDGDRIDIVVTCVDRKRDADGAPLLREVRQPDLDAQLSAWEAALSCAGAERPARARYKGEAWIKSLQLETDAEELGFRPVLWVASAGYGLIAADDPIGAYGATFSPPSDDDAGLEPNGQRSAVRRRHWWRTLARSRILDTGRPRRLAEIGVSNGGAPIVVVASNAYASAFGRDLQELLSSPEAMLVCANHALDGERSDPAFDHRIEGLLEDGTRLSLNQRVATIVLQRLAKGMSREELGESLRASTARAAAKPVPDRDPATDDEVRAFIRGHLRGGRTASKSPLLRMFRDGGRQCEQKRFGALFDEVKREAREDTLV